MTAPAMAYAPGGWVAIIHERLWALVEMRIDDPRVQPLWDAAREGIEEVLDVLLRDGLRALPSFAIADHRDDGIQYAVRGSGVIEPEGADAPLQGGGVSGWASGLLAVVPAEPARMVLHGGERPGDLRLPTTVGVTAASAVFVALAPRPADAESKPVVEAQPMSVGQGPHEATPATGADAPVAEPPLADDTGDHAAEYYQLLMASTTDRDALIAKLTEDGHSFAAGSSHADPASEGAGLPATADVAPTSNTTRTWPGDAQESLARSAKMAVPEGPPAPPSPPPASSGLISGVPWAAAPATPGEAQPIASAPVQAVEAVAGPVPVIEHPQGNQPTSPLRRATPGPPLPPGLSTERHSPSAMPRSEDADADSMTVSRASLLRQIEQPRGVEPTVLAVECPQGHLSPTYASSCRVCGHVLPEQSPVSVTRPSLGTLMLSNGSSVTLDRGVIFGRAPRTDIDDPSRRPHLVKLIDSEEISRMHASVVLDGWQVLLRDLGSQNGTLLTLPGGQPEQIRPNEDYPLEPGSLVSFAEVVSFRFEVTV